MKKYDKQVNALIDQTNNFFSGISNLFNKICGDISALSAKITQQLNSTDSVLSESTSFINSRKAPTPRMS